MVTVLVEGACEAPPRPRLTDPVCDATRPSSSYAVVSYPFRRDGPLVAVSHLHVARLRKNC